MPPEVLPDMELVEQQVDKHASCTCERASTTPVTNDPASFIVDLMDVAVMFVDNCDVCYKMKNNADSSGSTFYGCPGKGKVCAALTY